MLRYQTQPAREAALERTRTVASAMDDVVRVPGTNLRFGLDPLLSIVPVTGDAVGALISLYIVFEAVRLGVPKRTLARMLALVGLDFALGSIPVVGPLFDAFLRVNDRNNRLLESHVE
ncbi:DUF4112 domain-containing protein [Halomicroarcula sp. GCM10025324]|uniref:DUF4112 domain-containing protein n=1 Tax=Haloarcula TaxID=2237 RepID=UPI0023E7F058|nr:DUF4112 domain-containing protein [Halomicroarcula sp. ZS-22-S1]